MRGDSTAIPNSHALPRPKLASNVGRAQHEATSSAAADGNQNRALVASLARPRGNIICISDVAAEPAQKRLELLKAEAPKRSLDRRGRNRGGHKARSDDDALLAWDRKPAW